MIYYEARCRVGTGWEGWHSCGSSGGELGFSEDVSTSARIGLCAVFIGQLILEAQWSYDAGCVTDVLLWTWMKHFVVVQQHLILS